MKAIGGQSLEMSSCKINSGAELWMMGKIQEGKGQGGGHLGWEQRWEWV